MTPPDLTQLNEENLERYVKIMLADTNQKGSYACVISRDKWSDCHILYQEKEKNKYAEFEAYMQDLDGKH